MRLLFCCEFYYPSIGGVQEVMRQIAERLVRRGHEVTVATTKLANRAFTEHNGVKIVEFGITGNLVRGMHGEIERYQDFMKNFSCDALMIKAAQQWTFDALWPMLDSIDARKVFIPCGFSGLFDPSYAQYFKELPDVLRKFDHLIFYAEHYRDTDFARAHGLSKRTILANGACEIEFSAPPDPNFRSRHGIPEASFVLLTVGSMNGTKGHRELAEAFARLKAPTHHVTLILNGNMPPSPLVTLSVKPGEQDEMDSSSSRGTEKQSYLLKRIVRISGLIHRSVGVYRREGREGIRNRVALLAERKFSRVNRFLGLAFRSVGVFRREGILGVRARILVLLAQKMRSKGMASWLPPSLLEIANPLEFWIREAKKQTLHKQLLVTDFPRPELVQAYLAADLFVFASNIEYSPLVLFEAAAAGTPFLSVPVGNAEEIAAWTGAGIICPAPKDEVGFTQVVPKRLAEAIDDAMNDPQYLQQLGQAGRLAWQEKFTWSALSLRYEKILNGEEMLEKRTETCGHA